jgi:choline kinase
MKAIIIAAGSGTRLWPLTDDRPKCMLAINGKPIIEHQLASLRQCGITDITIVKGYKAEQIDCPGTHTIINTDYANNNVLESLFHAEAELTGDVVVSYADIVYRSDVLATLLRSAADISIVVDTDWKGVYVGRTQHPFDQAEKVIVSDGLVRRIGKHLHERESDGEFIGLARFSANGCALLRSVHGEVKRRGLEAPFQHATTFRKAYLTDIFQELVDRGQAVVPVAIRGGWREIDTTEDLEKASELAF